MKRIKKIVLLLFFIMVLVPFTTVFAADCTDVRNAKLELETLEASFEDKDCTNTDDAGVLSECNEIEVKKAAVLEKIFKYNADKVCPEVDLSSIITKYQDDCSNEFSSEVQEIADSVMNVFFITAPFILILFASLDFFKVMAGNDPAEMKKNRTRFIKRVVAFFLLYLTPVMVRWLFSLTPYDMNGTTYICAQAIDLRPKVTSAQVKGTFNGYKGSSRGGSHGSGTAEGEAIADAAAEIKEYIVNNDYYYGYPHSVAPDVLATDEQTDKHFCCATLIRGSLYRAGTYTVDELYGFLYDSYSNIWNESAGGTGQALYDQGWIAIWDPDELEPGDAILYHLPGSGWHYTVIDGTGYEVGHIEIYYGDGQKVNTGDGSSSYPGFSECGIITGFNSSPPSGDSQGFLCGLRYPGE